MPIPDLHANARLREIAPDIASLTIVFVNVYFLGEPGGDWVLVDAGIPMSSGRIRSCAEERFGRPPLAIVLTHGHFDHAGSALELANGWNVPIYSHRLEMPYLTGRSDYPPKDPTVGGVLAQMARLFPDHGYNFGQWVQALPADGAVPGLADWRWIHTPGHTHGHISLFRESDRFLIAGDALTTVDLDGLIGMLMQRPEFHRPPTPLTSDWAAARSSVSLLASLDPSVVAAGHGLPVTGPSVAYQLGRFAAAFRPPDHGRYVPRPALADALGVVAVPPAAPDRVRQIAASVAIAAAAGCTIFALLRTKQPHTAASEETPDSLVSSTMRTWK